MSEAEPRRSVRATKGQHTKSFDDQPIEPPKKRGRKKKQEEEPEEEIIRCVCGATNQEGDSEEPWIACDKCGAWQHNVCMGMSVFSEDLPKHYYCEQCAPQDHKELLAAMAAGEKPWEQRRKKYEEEQEQEQQNDKKKTKKKKGGRGAKRASDPKEELPPPPPPAKATESPAPESKPVKGKKESAQGKRKATEEPEQAPKGSSNKIRKVSQPETKKVDYTPPADLPVKLAEITDTTVHSTAAFLMRSIQFGLTTATKQGLFTSPKGLQASSRAERWAIQIERAVRDTHPDQKQYAAQCKTLAANLKNNPELSIGLLNETLSPPLLAVMTTDQMATKEQQQKNAELKAKSDKQSILITDDAPLLQRDRKGPEFIDNDVSNQPDENRPAPRRASTLNHEKSQDGERQSDGSAPPPLRVDVQGAQQSPKQSDFDINKVFSTVKSQSPTTHIRRASSQFGHTNGPGVDPDVDRLLQDDTESPPYSPTDESDPDIVWRGNLMMNSIAEFQASAKFAAGANLAQSAGLPWSTLIPRRMTVAGRIDDQKAIEYLCGLRYADNTDVVVVSLSPSSGMANPEFQKLFDYFTSKRKYAVIGDKGVGNVRDTYLVPVPPGDGNVPEFLLNFTDNLVPMKRTEPVLLAVFVYRNTGQSAEQLRSINSQSPVTSTPTPTATHGQAHRTPSISGPAFSPAAPQGQFQPPSVHNGHPTQGAHQVVPANQPPHGYAARAASDAEFQQQRERGEAIARDVLGPFINCPTVQFLLPQAYQMTRREWEICRGVYERDPKAREDLRHLSQLLQQEGNAAAQANAAKNAAAHSTQQAAPPST
ncbi:SPOC domain-containing protein [Plectosphaerella plurivora]|uniref:Transcription factor BYE1 n=1 Tax=Plectosphaerella plurivora TaxID=936078 RepID=A0A9P8V973_9PEZI|nr:SPOC domain-containing protein [Plectosphaerella plurivora]